MTMFFPTVRRTYRWRDPGLAWRAMQVLYAAAIAGFAAVLAIDLAYSAYNEGLFEIGAAMLEVTDQAYALTNIAMIPILLLCVVGTLVLTYILVANAHSQGGRRELASPTMAVGGYFIPIANLVLPPQMMGDLWRATFITPPRPPNGVIGWWWGTYLVGSALSLGFLSQREYEDIETMRALFALHIITAALSIVSALLTLRIFAALTREQAALRASTDAFG